MDYMRDEFGAIILEELFNRKDVFILETKLRKMKIQINGVLYYLKKSNEINNLYNELLAYEISKQYGIKSSYVDFFSYSGDFGTISRSNVNDNEHFYTICNYIGNAGNNLTDIWYCLYKYFGDYNIVSKLMCEIVNLFIFDVIIGNRDRHSDNYGLLFSGSSVSLAPLYDNENMLSLDSIGTGEYAIKVDCDDSLSNDSTLYRFLSYSDSMYLEYLESKLWIIEEKNILFIIKKVEEKIGVSINPYIKKEILRRFSTNLEMINNTIKRIKERGKKYEIRI